MSFEIYLGLIQSRNIPLLSPKVTNIIASGESRRKLKKHSVAESDEHKSLNIGHLQRPIDFYPGRWVSPNSIEFIAFSDFKAYIIYFENPRDLFD